MRYIQMIKRCKLPLKKATSDVEAHGEEHAKRCKLASGDLKSPPVSVDERLGHLKNSAVARLLVEGRLPVETVSSPKPGLMNDTAMDLSKSSVLGSVRSYQHDNILSSTDNSEWVDATAERLRKQMGAEMEALKKRGSSNEVRFAGWKCRYCPFTAHSAKKLYSHYQFHQQLLTSQSSKPHLEWLSAYRQSKEFAEGNPTPMTSSPQVTSSPSVSSSGENAFVFPHRDEMSPGFSFLAAFPNGVPNAENLQSLRSNGLSLRYLLGKNNNCNKRSESTENSASGCLRSIVQEVMKKDVSSPLPSSSQVSHYPPVKKNEGPNSVIGSSLSSSGNLNMQEATQVCQVQSRIQSIPERELNIPDGHFRNNWNDTDNEREKDEFCQTDAMHSVEMRSQIRNCIRVERAEHTLTMPQRPLSRESSSSYSSSTTSEEINVTDIPTQSLDHERPRNDSLMSDSSDNGPLRLVSRKRSHSAESERSSLCSPSGHHPGYPQLPKEHFQSPTSPHHFYPKVLPKNNATKSARLEWDSFKREVMDTRPNNSPNAVISSTGTPPPMQWSGQSFAHSGGTTPHKTGPLPSLVKLESSVQCELLVPPPDGMWPDQSPEMLRQAEVMDYQYNGSRYNGCPSVTGCIKCPHCGIAFDDSVLHSIHMGCHSHSDPFICNVCGEQCVNKYGFYTHIMRGHHSP